MGEPETDKQLISKTCALSVLADSDSDPSLDSTKPAWASWVALVVKNPPAMQETPVRFLGWEDPLEEGSTLSSILGVPLWLSW